MPTDPPSAAVPAPTPLAFPEHARYEQMFPTLDASEIARLRRFGTVRRYADGERLFETGKQGPGMFVLIAGHVAVTQRDGLGHVAPVVDQGPGQFLAEIGQLSEGRSLVDGMAEGDVEALLIPSKDLRALLVAEADLGERIMRALILRRVELIEAGAGGPVLVGAGDSVGMVRLQGFLSRNGQPYRLLDPSADDGAHELIGRYAPAAEDLPLVVCPNGTVLRNPSEGDLAAQLGMGSGAGRQSVYDVAVVGAGPAGLATAVYAASEGLAVLVLDLRAFGGQAGASARIENYLGFPTGISGQALAGRAFVQAQKFGAEMMIPAESTALDCRRADGFLALDLAGGARVRAKAVVIATGARYRRPAIDNLAAFEGRGVWYWASPIEARLCGGEEVILVGGGNSAGQAAVYLSGHARKVVVMIRGEGLAASMSRYLIERVGSTANIEVKTRTEIVALEGDTGGALARVRWRDHGVAAEQTSSVRNLFLFVGADPATDWLRSCAVKLDRAGFVITGSPSASQGAGQVEGPGDNTSSSLQSSVAGVFAVGDVRSGSVKRVGGAIGEGAQVVQALHVHLARMQTAQP